MNKSDLVNVVAAKAEITKKSADKAVSALFEAIKEDVAAKNRVQIAGFGSFEARARAARKGKNPQSGVEISIPAATVPAFRAGKAFKVATNGKKAAAEVVHQVAGERPRAASADPLKVAAKKPAAKKPAPKAKKK